MSDPPARPQLDLDAIVARIDRDLAQSARLRRESEKFIPEQRKLMSEARKFDRWFPPWLAVAGLIGGFVSIATLILEAFGKV